MNIFKRLWMAFTNSDHWQRVFWEWEEVEEAAQAERDFHKLRLCEKHQQRHQGTHHDEHNCDYCKLLGKMEKPGPTVHLRKARVGEVAPVCNIYAPGAILAHDPRDVTCKVCMKSKFYRTRLTGVTV